MKIYSVNWGLRQSIWYLSRKNLMFKIFDFLFKEEEEKDLSGDKNSESAVLHQKVQMFDNVEPWTEKEVNDAIYKSRFALVAIFSQLDRTNIILRWIRLLLLLILAILVYKLL